MLTSPTKPTIKTKDIDYQHAGTSLQGFLAYDEAQKHPSPGVLVVQEWWGLTDYLRRRCIQLAELGYTAFAPDMYGKGVTTDDPSEAKKLATTFYSDRDLMRSRGMAGLSILKQQPQANISKLAAIGFCFGGTVSLELARGGADLLGVVSFHGGLEFKNDADTQNIKAKLLILTGAEDPMVPLKKVIDFQEDLQKAGANYQINIYCSAVHAFTNPAADSHGIPGIAYNAQADQRSWEAMKDFFAEIFR